MPACCRATAMVAPAIRPPKPEVIEEVAELVTGRDTAAKEQTRPQNQLSAATVAFFQQHLGKRLARIAKHIAGLDREIIARIADPELPAVMNPHLDPGRRPNHRRHIDRPSRRARRVPDKQIAMLAGLAPIANQSGKHDGKRLIWGGRGRYAECSILPVSAIRWNPCLKCSTTVGAEGKRRQGRHRRSRQKTHHPRQHPHRPRSNLAENPPKHA